MVQPPSYVDPTFLNHVCLLQKSFYGLKQAPKAWFERLSTHLLHLGFQASLADSSLFILRHGKYLVFLLVYVDIVLTSNCLSLLQTLIQQLSSEFELKDLGNLHYFLGLQIACTSKGLFLNQSKYGQDLLLKHNMLSAKAAKTPCAPNLRLVLVEGYLLTNPHVYRSMVGSLHYLTFTMPDLSFAIHQVCQFMSAPSEAHLIAAKWILRYVSGIPNFGIFFQHGPLSLSAFSDSDWVGDPFDCRSTTEYLVYLGFNPITWSAKKQDTVSQSSTEFKYKAFAIATAKL